MTNIAIENGNLQWVFPLKVVIFHGYVRIPEGRWSWISPRKTMSSAISQWKRWDFTMSVIKHFTSWFTPGIFNLIYLIVNYIINIYKLSSENWDTYAGPMTLVYFGSWYQVVTSNSWPLKNTPAFHLPVGTWG
jgi:hypothetical protein